MPLAVKQTCQESACELCRNFQILTVSAIDASMVSAVEIYHWSKGHSYTHWNLVYLLLDVGIVQHNGHMQQCVLFSDGLMYKTRHSNAPMLIGYVCLRILPRPSVMAITIWRIREKDQQAIVFQGQNSRSYVTKI